MKVEVAVLGSLSIIVPKVSVDVKQLELEAELKSVEVDVLGSPSLIVLTASVDVLGSPSLIVLTASVDVKQH